MLDRFHSPTPAALLPAPRVLVVDDTEGNRYAVSHLLRGEGMEVTEAQTGREALAYVKNLPDLVILDINLPDMSGHEILRQIRADPEVSWLPVMHVSASYTASEDKALGLDLGADAYQTHPLDPPVFLATTRALLRLSRAEAKVRRAAQEWRAAFDTLNDAIFITSTDASHTVQRCNKPGAVLVGKEPRYVIGMKWANVLTAIGAQPGSKAFEILPDERPHHFNDVKLRDRWYNISRHDSPVTSAESFCVCVVRDITERKEAEAERETLIESADAARIEAEQANRVKGEFLAVMSHELRTPLNAIGGYVELLSMGLRGPITSEQAFDLDRIKRSQSSLIILINDVLNFAKVESGELKYHITTFPLNEALERASELIEHQIEQRGVAFRREQLDESPLLKADADKVQQVILNLLSNAVKFTPPGGAITLSSRVEGDSVVVLVADTGIGVPPHMVDAIFEPFVQVQTSRARQQAGVGLGLAISRDLARGMGGDLILVNSTPEGSTFLLKLRRG